MTTKFYGITELIQLKIDLIKSDENAINKVISELNRLEEIIKDYEVGLRILNDKFISKYNKTPKK